MSDIIERTYDYLCLNFWTSLNYGAVLTAYAAQSVLDSLGFKNAHIDYRYKHVKDRFDGSFTDRFAEKYLHKTLQCGCYKDFLKLNAITQKGFIVGSDQVFRDDYIKKTTDYYLLAFAKPDKQRIAISASFGKDNFKLKKKECLFQAMDGISVREDNGLELCESLGVKAEHILDPVFLADKKVFEELIQSVEKPSCNVVGYILDENEEVNSYTSQFDDDYINIAHKNLSVEEFLAYIYYAQKVVTDSFHGTCFAIIFNKPFRTFDNKGRGSSRFESLFKTFGLNYDNFNTNINWERINEIINEERCKGLNWLKSTLTTDDNTKHNLKLRTFRKAKVINIIKSIIKKA